MIMTSSSSIDVSLFLCPSPIMAGCSLPQQAAVTGSRCGRILPEDIHRPEDDQFDDRPTHESQHRGDVEDRPRATQGVGVEYAVEGRDEHVADVHDAGDDAIPDIGVEQAQDDARADDDLDQPGDKHDDALGNFFAFGTCACDPVAIGPRCLLTSGCHWPLGDDGPVRPVAIHRSSPDEVTSIREGDGH